ncbi:major histocompatibility complex class I-related gene protein-like [Thamnophis elegans]|uniref:major histocompatibility complex class I-related gene protein-like n=1 Tax=Thamnophis elegans TaxID=35005 RepID=UPI00137790C4|nr:major histocompatibility complex class I-related gene protein-like [Thamnophis elegans]
MQLYRAPLLLLGAALGSLLPGGLCDSSRHSLCYSYLKISEPNQGLPEFLSVIHLDDHPIALYDILNGMTVPLVPWMEAEEVKTPERIFRADLEWLSNRNPQTGGLHTWQMNLGCELIEDGSKRGFLHYGYNGRDFISFDKETLRWVTAQPQAQKVKEKWEENPRWSWGKRDFLEKTCIVWLKTYLPHQKKALKKTEPPVGKVTSKVVDDSLEVLICQAFGFYPKEIRSTWMRDGEICQYETLHRNVVPNSDGTYYVQLSIEIDPKERDRFRCRLEHEGLQEPLVLSFKEERATEWWIPVGAVVGVIFGAVIFFLMGSFWRCRMIPYQKAKSSVDDLPSGILSSSLNCGTDNKIQSELMLQSEVTSEDMESCGERRPQRVVEDSGSTLRRREGKKKPLTKSITLDKAEAIELKEGSKAEKVTVRSVRRSHTVPMQYPRGEEGY